MFSNDHVNIMYINCSPMDIDLNDSTLLTFIFIFLVCLLQIFFLCHRVFFVYSLVEWVFIKYFFLCSFFFLFIADLDVHWVSCCSFVILLSLFIDDIVLFIVLNGAHHLDGRLVSTIWFALQSCWFSHFYQFAQDFNSYSNSKLVIE